MIHSVGNDNDQPHEYMREFESDVLEMSEHFAPYKAAYTLATYKGQR